MTCKLNIVKLLTGPVIISATYAEIFEDMIKNKYATEFLGELSPELSV
jgi:hypothetical protein